VIKEKISMEWIFVGTLVVLVAQLIEYMIDSTRGRVANLHLPAFSKDLPPGDAPLSADIAVPYDRAA
jgi:hypothetical protein